MKFQFRSLLPGSILIVLLVCVTARADYFDSPYSRYSYGGYDESFGSSTSQPPIYSLTSNPRENRNTSLRIAAREDRANDVEQLLNDGAEVNSRSDNGATALMYASRFCLPNVVRVLLAHKAEVNSQDRLGRTALMFAARDNCLPVVRLLVHTPNLQIKLTDDEQKTAIDYAGTAFELVDIMKQSQRRGHFTLSQAER